MSGIDGVSGRKSSPWEDTFEKPLPKEAEKTAANIANAPWLQDADGGRNSARAAYPTAIFSNPAMFGPAVSLAPPPPPPAAHPAPLAAAPNAMHGVTLANLAENVPSGTRSDPSRAFTCGAGYKLYPEVSKQPDGKDAVVYWNAFNKETKRVEFLVGPDSLKTFTSAPSEYATAAANALMGEQDGATRESMRVVDVAVRRGFGPAIDHLATASIEAWTDPKWVAKTTFNVVSSLAGPAETRAAASEMRAEASPVVESPTSGLSRATLSPGSNPPASISTFSYKNVNPGFPAPGRTMNCVNCAVATDATLAGRPATALPTPGPLQLEDVQNAVGGSFVEVASPADVEAALLRSGPGSRAIVAGFRADPNPGHVFNAVNEGGRVQFLDGQTGAPAVVADPTYTDWAMLVTHPRKQ